MSLIKKLKRTNPFRQLDFEDWGGKVNKENLARYFRDSFVIDNMPHWKIFKSAKIKGNILTIKTIDGMTFDIIVYERRKK